SLTAVWLLREPVRVDTNGALGRVANLQRALAEAVGGRIDEVKEIRPRFGSMRPGVAIESVPAWSPTRAALRLPGSRIRCFGNDGRLVRLVHADVDARCTIEELELGIN